MKGFLKYIAVSVCANFLALHAVSIEGVSASPDVPATLRVSLMSAAASDSARRFVAETASGIVRSEGGGKTQSGSFKTAGSGTSTVIENAEFRLQTPPSYPPRAVELRQEGTVVLLATVSKSGIPAEIKVERSSGYPLLDMSALRAVRKWEFETSEAEKRFPGRVRVPVRFVID